MLQSVQRPGVYDAGYNTLKYRNNLIRQHIRVGLCLNLGRPPLPIPPQSAESDVKKYS